MGGLFKSLNNALGLFRPLNTSVGVGVGKFWFAICHAYEWLKPIYLGVTAVLGVALLLVFFKVKDLHVVSIIQLM